ncbi:ribosome-associated translation inhibitor RaiA [Angustibacter peucedani]
MEIVVTGRHVEVKERFRRHLEEKLAKVPQLAPRIQRLDVVISHEPTKDRDSCERVEITCVGKGPVVRAEACADDPYVALDRVYMKLLERLRRQHSRKVERRSRGVESLAQAAARLAPPLPEVGAPETNGTAAANGSASSELDDSPIHIREKVHAAVPMTLQQALYEMELVGHDFFLFCDAESHRPSVVYRRRGWEYGVLHLDVDHDGTSDVPAFSDAATG